MIIMYMIYGISYIDIVYSNVLHIYIHVHVIHIYNLYILIYMHMYIHIFICTNTATTFLVVIGISVTNCKKRDPKSLAAGDDLRITLGPMAPTFLMVDPWFLARWTPPVVLLRAVAACGCVGFGRIPNRLGTIPG